MRIRDFDALTFDCYGTLIDWESGCAEVLGAWAHGAGVEATDEELLAAFAAAESQVERAAPKAPYREVLRRVHGEIAAAFGRPPDEAAARRLAESVGGWRPFDDTVEALGELARRYSLVIVSNVDRASFEGTRAQLGVELDAVVTAEDVGAYKPDHAPFLRAFDLLAEQGVERTGILHVAQSLYHDHAPAHALGLRSVWVDRRRGKPGWGATPPPPAGVRPDFTVASLAELVERQDEDW